MRVISILAIAVLSLAPAAWAEGTVRAMSAAGETVWAVGDAGLVLRSDDDGRTWTKRPCEARADLLGAHFTSADAGVVFGGTCVPGHPGGATRGVILRTADGRSFQPLSAVGLPALHAGRMEGERAIVFGRPSPRDPAGAWLTVTDGRLWVPVKTATRGTLLGGTFSEVRTGCLVGPGHRIVHIRRMAEQPVRGEGIDAAAALTCVVEVGQDLLAAGEDGSVLVRSAETGQWSVRALPLPRGTRRLADISAAAADGRQGRREVWLAGGLAGTIFHSADGGRTFKAGAAPGPGPVTALSVTEAGTLLAGGCGGRIWRSDDAGKTWTRTRGGERVDVLVVAGPADVSVLPAVAAHAAAGADVAVVYAAMPTLASPDPARALRGDVPLRAAAAILGSAGAMVVTDFDSIAAHPAAGTMDADAVLKHWSAGLDIPARAEAARQIAAAIRLYRPRVLVRGPDGDDVVGPPAESHLVSRLVEEAARAAGDAEALAELAALGLKAHAPDRIYAGLDDNDRYTPPWEEAPVASAGSYAAQFVGWHYPAEGKTSLSMTALAASAALPWVDPMERPAEVTTYRCSEIIPVRPLFTSGLTSARLERVAPPAGEAVASGALLRAAGGLDRRAGAAIAPIARAMEAHPSDPLSADRLWMLGRMLSERGRVAEGLDAAQRFADRGEAHPLFERANVSGAARFISSEWAGKVIDPRLCPDEKTLRAAMLRLVEPRWRPWVEDEHGAMLLARANAALRDFEGARAALKQLAEQSPDPAWKLLARTELAAMDGPAEAIAAADGLTVAAAGAAVKIDGATDEAFWAVATKVELSARAEGSVPATVRMAAAPDGLAIAVRVGPGGGGAPGDEKTSLGWRLLAAVDADRDAWTQLIFTCEGSLKRDSSRSGVPDSTARRDVTIRTHLGGDGKLDAKLAPVQARADSGGWTVEALIPYTTMGIDARSGALLRMQLALDVIDGGRTETRRLVDLPDGPLQPHRYRLVALPGLPEGRP